jgi:hypothetical protein
MIEHLYTRECSQPGPRQHGLTWDLNPRPQGFGTPLTTPELRLGILYFNRGLFYTCNQES